MKGEINEMNEFGLGKIVSEKEKIEEKMIVKMKNDECRIVKIFMEKKLKEMKEKINRSVVVIKKKKEVKNGFYGFRMSESKEKGEDLRKVKKIGIEMNDCIEENNKNINRWKLIWIWMK